MITKEDQQTAIQALTRALADRTPLMTGQPLGPNGAMCSCAVIAFALGYEYHDDTGFYDFLYYRGFDVEAIFYANDSIVETDGEFMHSGGFAAAREVIKDPELHELQG